MPFNTPPRLRLTDRRVVTFVRTNHLYYLMHSFRTPSPRRMNRDHYRESRISTIQFLSPSLHRPSVFSPLIVHLRRVSLCITSVQGHHFAAPNPLPTLSTPSSGMLVTGLDLARPPQCNCPSLVPSFSCCSAYLAVPSFLKSCNPILQPSNESTRQQPNARKRWATGQENLVRPQVLCTVT